MKKLLSFILCVLILTACGQNMPHDNSRSEIQSTLTASPVITPTPYPAESAISGEAPLYIKELLYRLMYGGMIYDDWSGAEQLIANHLFGFYINNEVYDNYDELSAEYGTIRSNGKDWLAIPSDVYQQYIFDCFGSGTPPLNAIWEYVDEADVYKVDSYFSKPSVYDVKITDYTEENGQLTIEYTSTYYDGNIHQRIMKAKQTEAGWQYLSNGYDENIPYTEPFPAVNMEKEKLTDYAMTLAEHIVEYGRTGSYSLADVNPENISRLFMTMYMYTEEGMENRTDHPYLSVINYEPSKNSYSLSRAQMMAHQLYGIENWFVPYTGYHYTTQTFANPTEIGWGFGPAARDISAAYISADEIRVDIYAENAEAEEKYNFTVYFDVMTENDCTFLRFNEMTAQKL